VALRTNPAPRNRCKQCFAISLAITSQSGFRKTGKPRNRARRNMPRQSCQRDYARAIMKDHHKPEKLRMECVGKAVAPLPNPPPAGKLFPGAGEGI
jgi:hypothetical protein